MTRVARFIFDTLDLDRYPMTNQNPWNSLFRRTISLFGRINSLIPVDQGNRRSALQSLAEWSLAARKTRQNGPRFPKFPDLFPVLRESGATTAEPAAEHAASWRNKATGAARNENRRIAAISSSCRHNAPQGAEKHHVFAAAPSPHDSGGTLMVAWFRSWWGGTKRADARAFRAAAARVLAHWLRGPI